MNFQDLKNSNVRKLTKEEQKQIKANAPRPQGCAFLLLAFFLFISFCATGQTAKIDELNFIKKSETAPTVYTATVQVSKKKAVRLLCEQIKSRTNTSVQIPTGEVGVDYENKVYFVKFKGKPIFENTKISEVRKFCKTYIEGVL